MVDHEENPLAGNDPAGDGELSGQLADESGKPGEDAEEFLSDERLAAYGRYTRPPTVDELDQFFVLDDEDRNLIADKRGDANRLGFMLQLTTLRYLGKFLDDPLDVPAMVLDDVAAQLGIADPSCVKAYSQRVNTKWEHQREIRQRAGWRGYGEGSAELALWLDRRCWNTGETSAQLFYGAIGWLRQRQVELPGLARLMQDVSGTRSAAEARLRHELVSQINGRQATFLLSLLDVNPKTNKSALEILRRRPVEQTVTGLIKALRRVGEVAGANLGGVDVTVVPQRRLRELARDGMMRNATALRRRRPYEYQLATLLSAIVYLEAKATDDALELFDLIVTSDLLARAERASKTEKLRRYPRLSRDAGKLAAAVEVLLEAVDWGENITLDVVWDAIENVVSRSELRASVANVGGLVLPPDADPDGEWRAALTQRYPLVKKFLRLLVETVEFGATADSAKILIAFQSLPDLVDANPTRRVPSGCLDARKVEVDVVPAGWRPLVFKDPRPEGTVDRNGYVFCVLEQFYQRLKRRDIFAAASSRWADPRAQLLSGQVWEARREELLDSMQLPEHPGELLAEWSAELGATWQYMAGRAQAGDINVGKDGRLHAAALKAIAEPASLRDLRNTARTMMPKADIGDVVQEVMSWHPEFIASYTHISRGGPISADMAASLAAVLTAQALNVGWAPVVSPGVEALTRSRINHVYQNYVRPECHAAANAPLIWGQAGIPTATLWGGGLVAAVDGTRFVVPVRSIDARPNPKYFGRKKGVTWLNMINDQGVGTAGIVLSGTPRDSLYAIDLMYRRDGGARPEVFISDTGSYSDMVFGLLKLLGVDYRPELAGLPDRRLWRTVRAADSGPLDIASRNLIDLKKIKRHWSDILRIAASVHAGEVAASEVMRILQRGGNPTQLGDALAHFGRIFKTLHVLSYVDREQYRRDIKRMRNPQEERHRLAKYICHGRRGELREKYHAGMEDQLGALGLVVNCVALWNTVYLDRILATLRESGYPVLDEDVLRIHPYWYAHINVHGHYSFQPLQLAEGIGRRPLRDPGKADPNEE